MIPFTKMHGLGNDFIVIDHFFKNPHLSGDVIHSEFAKKICDRRFGVGADQILHLKPTENADFRMEIWNADGSIAEMCGNGIRAVGVYAQSYLPQSSYLVETLAGIKKISLINDHLIQVDMGIPTWKSLKNTFNFKDSSLFNDELIHVNVGNPHCVIFSNQSLEKIPLNQLGPEIENHSFFAPGKTNVEFVQIINSHSISVRVWERGAGITLACGTGACASAVASIVLNQAKTPLLVSLPGGKLTIDWQGEGFPLFMTGPAEKVFDGIYIN